jgi:hypothetical protein
MAMVSNPESVVERIDEYESPVPERENNQGDLNSSGGSSRGSSSEDESTDGEDLFTEKLNKIYRGFVGKHMFSRPGFKPEDEMMKKFFDEFKAQEDMDKAHAKQIVEVMRAGKTIIKCPNCHFESEL